MSADAVGEIRSRIWQMLQLSDLYEDHSIYDDMLNEFASMAVAAERERIVKALDEITKRPQKNSPAFMWADEAIAIVQGDV
jgi:hypothetical protein